MLIYFEGQSEPKILCLVYVLTECDPSQVRRAELCVRHLHLLRSDDLLHHLNIDNSSNNIHSINSVHYWR